MAGIHKFALCLGVIAAAASLSACSGAPDVELESPLLGKLGLLGGAPKREAKLIERPPLVPPPTKKLPVPASEQPAEASLDWPVDPGDRKKELAALKKKKQKEYEEKGDWSKNRDAEEFDKLLDGLSRRKGIFGDWSADIGRGTPEALPEKQ